MIESCKKKIAEKLADKELAQSDIYAAITVPPEKANGDLCLPCFKFAKALRLSPAAIAQGFAARFEGESAFGRVEAVNGYLNFYINRAEAVQQLLDASFNYTPPAKKNKTVCIDYSSVNIAKPFHIGHLLTTAIGGALYRMYGYLGYDAVGINHLGDWGTQFGKLITAYKKWSSADKVEKEGMDELLKLYVRFHAEAEKDKSLEDEGRAWFKKIESGDAEALEIFRTFKEVTLTEVQKVYRRLGIEFDSYNGESFYNDKLDAVVEELKAKNLLTQSDGAMVVDLEAYGMPPCLILKSDGASLYATRDLAAALYRKKTYNFDKSLYVVAYQQNLHFKQFFKVLELMGYDWAKDMVHVAFGMVSLEGGASLSTRKGNVVKLNEVLNTAVQKTRDIINEKNPDLPDKEAVAEQVGVGAVVFGALQSARIKDMVFSYDKALSFEGETAPYVQYTHARCCSVLGGRSEFSRAELEPSEFYGDAAYEILKAAADFDAVVALAAERYEPSILARYLIDLAQSFNRYYLEYRIAGNVSRLFLTKTVRDTLKKGLRLLLVNAPERM